MIANATGAAAAGATLRIYFDAISPIIDV